MQSGWQEQLTTQSHDTQPNPIVRIENGVVHVGAPRLAQTEAGNAPFWRGVLLMAVFVMLLGGMLTGILLTRPTLANSAGPASSTATPAPSATPAPTNTPQPALPTVSQSWGQNAATANLSLQLDASRTFQASGMTPDGTLLLGTLTSKGVSQLGTLNRFTKNFSPFTPPATLKLTSPRIFATDGRFVIIIDSVVSGATCANCNLRYSVFDLYTRVFRPVVIGSSFGGITTAQLDHGTLLLQTGTAGIQMVDLTTSALTPTPLIALNAGDPAPLALAAFAWPNLVYFAKGSSPTLRLRDLALATDAALPTFTDLPADVTHVNVAITGDSLFVAYPDNDTLRVQELDHVTSGGTTITDLTSYPDSHGALLTANDRLLSFAGRYPFVWDRTEGHWVVVTDAASASAGVNVLLAGHFLAVITQTTASAPQQVTLYDTAALPTAGTANA